MIKEVVIKRFDLYDQEGFLYPNYAVITNTKEFEEIFELIKDYYNSVKIDGSGYIKYQKRGGYDIDIIDNRLPYYANMSNRSEYFILNIINRNLDFLSVEIQFSTESDEIEFVKSLQVDSCVNVNLLANPVDSIREFFNNLLIKYGGK